MIDETYKELVETVLTEGEEREDRTGVGTLSIFDYHFTYDMEYGYPLLSTKKITFNNVMYELNAFLRGEVYIEGFSKCKQLWEAWASPTTGYLGPSYGQMFTNYGDHDYESKGVNQLKWLISGLKSNPYSRRHVVSLWDARIVQEQESGIEFSWVDYKYLPPCHFAFVCYVSGKDTLNLKFYMRSVDVAVGLPYNIASYALLLKMLASECGYKVGTLAGDLTNVHIYKNHLSQIKEQINRSYNNSPALIITPKKTFWELVHEDDPKNYLLLNYFPKSFIKYALAV